MQASTLEAPFTKDEVFLLLKEVGGEKTLGPNGFSFRFAQSFWEVFKSDLIGLFQRFYMDTVFDHRFSKFFIALILKVKGPSSLNDFRPISFVGRIHKLVAKVLISRLHMVIDHLISHI